MGDSRAGFAAKRPSVDAGHLNPTTEPATAFGSAAARTGRSA